MELKANHQLTDQSGERSEARGRLARRDRLNSIHSRVEHAFNHCTKPHLNTLSRGCQACGRGTWALVYITLSCTRQCFFCLREQEEPDDFLPYVDRYIKFESPTGFIDYLNSFQIEGIAFSGGEPFLAFDLLLEYVKAIRYTFGRQHYIWVYTNGDLITAERLTHLVEAGLDEIRLDISAREYDLQPVLTALAHVPHVTVEFPAIPEDVERVKNLLPRLEAIGVKNINLHQLMLNEYNREILLGRGYTAVGEEFYPDWFPIVESESVALEILKYAAEHNAQIGVNYCSRLYKKLFFQQSSFRLRYAHMCRSSNEVITPTGYVRGLANYSNTEGPTDPTDLLAPEGPAIKVAYYEPGLHSSRDDVADACRVHRLDRFKVSVGKWLSAEIALTNATAKLFFQLLFVEHYALDEAYRELTTLFDLKPAGQEAMWQELQQFHQRFAMYEYLPQWMPAWEGA